MPCNLFGACFQGRLQLLYWDLLDEGKIVDLSVLSMNLRTKLCLYLPVGTQKRNGTQALSAGPCQENWDPNRICRGGRSQAYTLT